MFSRISRFLSTSSEQPAEVEPPAPTYIQSAWRWNSRAGIWQEFKTKTEHKNRMLLLDNPLLAATSEKKERLASMDPVDAQCEAQHEANAIVHILFREKIVMSSRGSERSMQAELLKRIRATNHLCTDMMIVPQGLVIFAFNQLFNFIEENRGFVIVDPYRIMELQAAHRLVCIPPLYQRFVELLEALDQLDSGHALAETAVPSSSTVPCAEPTPSVCASSSSAASSEKEPHPDWVLGDDPVRDDSLLFRAIRKKIKAAKREINGYPCGNVSHLEDTTNLVDIFFQQGIFMVRKKAKKHLLQDEFHEAVLTTQPLCEGIMKIYDPDAVVIRNFDFLFNFAKDHENVMVVSLRKINELQSNGLLAYPTADYYRFAAMIKDLYPSYETLDSGDAFERLPPTYMRGVIEISPATRSALPRLATSSNFSQSISPPKASSKPPVTSHKEGFPSENPDPVPVPYRGGYSMASERADTSKGLKIVHPDGREVIIPPEKIIRLPKEQFDLFTRDALKELRARGK